jgi:hypothetical protein
MSDKDSNGGLGFFGWVLTIFVLWALVEGLPTPWGVFHIDLLPPAIRLEQAADTIPADTVPQEKGWLEE